MRTLLILLWCLCGMLAARSQTDYRQRTPQLLKRIDFLVEHKEETHDRVGKQIGQLKKQALQATGQHKGNLLREIIAMYMHFKTDSAAVYIRELSQLADTLHDERLMLHAVVAQAGWYSFGYNDEVVPPTSSYSTYNIIKAPKTLSVYQMTGHYWYQEQWDEWQDFIRKQMGIEK